MKVEKSRRITLAILTVWVLTIGTGTTLTAQEHGTKHTHYKVIDLGTLGGPNSYVTFTPIPMNSMGTVVGTADTRFADPFAPQCFLDCFLIHTFQWREGKLIDLRALADNASSNPNGINAKGVIAGISENGLTDSGFASAPEFDAVVWKDDQILDLGTFGGTFSYANAINNRSQVVGFALNGLTDAFFMDECGAGPMPTQMRAFLWDDGGGLQDLGTLGGPESCALWINEQGQVAGHSFTSFTPNSGTGIPTQDPFIWTKRDGMIDLGNLGGTIGHASGINNRGQVAGDSNLTGDQIQHAFLWDHGKMQDLTVGRGPSFAHALNHKGDVVGGSLSADGQSFNGFVWRHGVMTDLDSVVGDGCSAASGINSKGQIVGRSFSCTGDASHAFISENGNSEINLNTLIRPRSNLRLTDAQFINEKGEITGIAVLPNGDEHAFILIPKQDSEDAGVHSGAEDVLPLGGQNVANANKLTPEMLAKLRARFTHRTLGLGVMRQH